jgi:hypothetical protein
MAIVTPPIVPLNANGALAVLLSLLCQPQPTMGHVD